MGALLNTSCLSEVASDMYCFGNRLTALEIGAAGLLGCWAGDHIVAVRAL